VKLAGAFLLFSGESFLSCRLILKIDLTISKGHILSSRLRINTFDLPEEASMTKPSPRDITQMLIDWSNGDREALDRLMPVVYTELRRQAARHLRRERAGHTLQTTDLIHEAYIRLIDQKNVRWQNRAHFFAVAAQSMRRILVDHARLRHRVKRGGSGIALALDEGLLVVAEKSVDLLALDEALTRLAAM